MKKFILGFISALAAVAIIFIAFLFIRGFSGGGGSVSPQNLKPGATDFGSLRVEIFGKGNPLNDVEVDLGKVGPNGPTGPMSFTVTDSGGAAIFEKVPVGDYDIFFNANHFPSGYVSPLHVPVSITKGQMTEKRIDLMPKQ